MNLKSKLLAIAALIPLYQAISAFDAAVLDKSLENITAETPTLSLPRYQSLNTLVQQHLEAVQTESAALQSQHALRDLPDPATFIALQSDTVSRLVRLTQAIQEAAGLVIADKPEGTKGARIKKEAHTNKVSRFQAAIDKETAAYAEKEQEKETLAASHATTLERLEKERAELENKFKETLKQLNSGHEKATQALKDEHVNSQDKEKADTEKAIEALSGDTENRQNTCEILKRNLEKQLAGFEADYTARLHTLESLHKKQLKKENKTHAESLKSLERQLDEAKTTFDAAMATLKTALKEIDQKMTQLEEAKAFWATYYKTAAHGLRFETSHTYTSLLPAALGGSDPYYWFFSSQLSENGLPTTDSKGRLLLFPFQDLIGKDSYQSVFVDENFANERDILVTLSEKMSSLFTTAQELQTATTMTDWLKKKASGRRREMSNA